MALISSGADREAPTLQQYRIALARSLYNATRATSRSLTFDELTKDEREKYLWQADDYASPCKYY